MRGFIATTVAFLLCAGTACSGSDDLELPPEAQGLRVASFDFAESELLAELYAQTLETRGVPVVRLGAVGPREVIAPALELDRVDLVPEYMGTAIEFFGASGPQTVDSTLASSDALQQLLAPRGLVALDAADAQNSNAIVITADFAAEGNIVTISDLVPNSSELVFGGPVECPERPLCLLGLQEVYGLVFVDFVPQRSVAVTAEALIREEIDVGLAFTTSPELTDDALVVLEDDRELQPPENVVPVIRSDALERWGAPVSESLNALSSALTTRDLRTMNRRLLGGASVAEVAADWVEFLLGDS